MVIGILEEIFTLFQLAPPKFSNTQGAFYSGDSTMPSDHLEHGDPFINF